MKHYIYQGSALISEEDIAENPAMALRTQLLGIFNNSLTLGQRIYFTQAAEAVRAYLANGDIASAKELIRTWPLFDPTLETTRSEMLACFPN